MVWRRLGWMGWWLLWSALLPAILWRLLPRPLLRWILWWLRWLLPRALLRRLLWLRSQIWLGLVIRAFQGSADEGQDLGVLAVRMAVVGKEKAWLYPKRVGDLREPAGADAVGAPFVFLHLLE